MYVSESTGLNTNHPESKHIKVKRTVRQLARCTVEPIRDKAASSARLDHCGSGLPGSQRPFEVNFIESLTEPERDKNNDRTDAANL